MASIKRMNFWYGRVIDSTEGAELWEAIENWQDRWTDFMLEFTGLGSGDTTLLKTPPPLSNLSVDDIDVGPWEGWSQTGPCYQDGTQTVDFSAATHGSLQGSVDVVTSGKVRTIVIMARYAIVDVGAAVDANNLPVFNEQHHGIEYRIIMGNEYTFVSQDGTPPDYESEIAAGSIPLVTVIRDETQANVVHRNFFSYKYPDGQPQTDKWIKDQLRIPGTHALGGLGGSLDYFSALPTPSIVSPGGTSHTIRLDLTNPNYFYLVDRVVDSVMLTGLDGMPIDSTDFTDYAAGDWYVRMKIDDRDGKYVPIIYLADATDLPSADGDDFTLVSFGDVGNDYVAIANFPTTARDILLALVNWDGTSNAPTFTTKYRNPPVYLKKWTQARNMSSVSNITLNISPDVAREFMVHIETVPVDFGDGGLPANRDVPHNISARVLYQDMSQIVCEVRGSYLDTTGAFAVPGSTEYFQPEARFKVVAIDPS